MWKWIKVPKIVALAAFFLPWVTVSCSGTKLISASGFGMATGHYTNDMAGLAKGMGQTPRTMAPPSDGRINEWLIAALIVVVLGLTLSFLRARRGAAIGVIAASVGAMALIWLGTYRLSKAYLLAEAHRNQPPSAPVDPQMQQAMMGMIQIDWHFGYWLTLGALVVAAFMAWLSLTGRGAAVEEGLDAGFARQREMEGSGERICPSCGRHVPADARFCPHDGTSLD